MAIEAFSFKIFMTGDSHVASKIYPERVGDILVDADPEIEFSFAGHNGAAFYTFNETPSLMHSIYAAEPDILIVHLGTNDSYTKDFNNQKFLSDVEEFYDNVRNNCPDVLTVFITPFYNRLKDGSVNKSTRECADAIVRFAKARENVFVIDNNEEYGMHFLDNSGTLMRPDGVHLTVEGYEELGDQVGQGLIDIDELWINSL